jgi:glycosyltransferase involved in cell wall biosynthesis
MTSDMPDLQTPAMRATGAKQPSTVPPIGIIVPSFNRSDVLLRCFQHLEAQTWKDFEVVVVDDGSTDETPCLLEAYAARTPLSFRHVRQENAGPAGARNHAISLLTAPVCLMIGDDIMASPTLVEKHLAFHQTHPDKTSFAIGYSRWAHQGQTVTPFMQWLEEGGLQFAYAALLKGASATWEHFYTSNLSGKTELLRANPFNENFTRNVMEDIELGYRLARQGELQISFLPDALGEHIHPTDVVRSCQRMITAGYATDEFFRFWPERTPPSPTSLKGRLRKGLLQRGVGLGLLRMATSVLTRFWCPNPLLKHTLLLHHESGWRQAEVQQP